MTNALTGSAERSRSGVAAGTLNPTRQVGGVLGVAIFGSLIAHGNVVTGVHIALVTAIALIAIGALLTAALRTTKQADQWARQWRNPVTAQGAGATRRPRIA
jgi:DHA2 family methylenomycin A resistance protein-like MFS transporter